MISGAGKANPGAGEPSRPVLARQADDAVVASLTQRRVDAIMAALRRRRADEATT